MKPSTIAKTFIVIATILMVFTGSALAGEVTLVGEINDNYQLVADGQIYEIADTATGNDLAENYISARVQVTGTVETAEETNIITVISYTVVPD
jgi:hypothetical protein